ncbi:MAG: transposase [Polyangiaceae bacterium]|nr:transposase [Polyangiaceae bacterium]
MGAPMAAWSSSSQNVRKDGTRALLLEPEDLLVRLCACVPPPWFNMIRYFGVLSSHSRHRARVVPSVVEPSRFVPEAVTGDPLELGFGSGGSSASALAPRQGRSRWGWLLAHVFRADMDTCVRCGGPMRWVEVATEPGAIARRLAKHRLASEPAPERRPRTASGQLLLPFA